MMAMNRGEKKNDMVDSDDGRTKLTLPTPCAAECGHTAGRVLRSELPSFHREAGRSRLPGRGVACYASTQYGNCDLPEPIWKDGQIYI